MNVYEKILRGESEVDEGTRLRLGRLVVVISGIATMVLAWVALEHRAPAR
jgi:hypothetical protein